MDSTTTAPVPAVTIVTEVVFKTDLYQGAEVAVSCVEQHERAEHNLRQLRNKMVRHDLAVGLPPDRVALKYGISPLSVDMIWRRGDD